MQLNPEYVQGVFDRIDGPLYMSHYEARKLGHDEWLKENYPDFRPPEELTATRERAYASGDWAKVVQSEYALMQEALTESLTPKLRDQVRAELEAEAKAAVSEEATARRKAAPRPTNVDGSAPPKTDYRKILGDPEATEEERNKAFEKVYGFPNQ